MSKEIFTRSTFELHITRNEDEYLFLLNDPSRHTCLIHERIIIPSSIRRTILDKLNDSLSSTLRPRGIVTPQSVGKNPAQVMTEFGSSIFQYMLPLNIRKHLLLAGHNEVILTTNDVEIPWELAHDGDSFLCLKHAVGRKVQTKVPFKEVTREAKETLAGLFISDPTKELPDAEREVSSIVQYIASLEFVDACYLKQEEANIPNLIQKLQVCLYDIFHFAGHVEFNIKHPEESSLRFQGESMTAMYLFQIMNAPPKFVFINACSSAKAGNIDYLEREGKLSGMASAFLSSGVDAYIGTLWPVHDDMAKELSLSFYKRILAGETIGSSLKDAKKDIFSRYGDYTNTWGSFILYGEPSLTLVSRKRDEKIRAKIHLKRKKTTQPEIIQTISPEKQAGSVRTKPLSIVSKDEVITWRWDEYKFLEEVVNLDYETIENLTHEHEGDIEQWVKLYFEHPDTWRVLVNHAGNIVGYWHFVPLFEREFQMSKQGTLFDYQITVEKVKYIELPGLYNIYFVGICVKKEFRGINTLRLLFSSLLDVFTNLAKHGIFIGEISTNAYTPSGIALCKSVGLKYIGNHLKYGQIYAAEFSTLFCSPLFKEHGELKNLYLQNSLVHSY